MKLGELVKKINGATVRQDVYVCAPDGTERKLVSFDFNGYPFKEDNKTVRSINLYDGKVVINYK